MGITFLLLDIRNLDQQCSWFLAEMIKSHRQMSG